MTEELKAQYSALPFQSGDGYGFGGAAVVAIGDMAVLVGEGPKAHSLAKQLAAAWNTRAPSTELTQLVKAARALVDVSERLSPENNPFNDIRFPEMEAVLKALVPFKEVGK